MTRISSFTSSHEDLSTIYRSYQKSILNIYRLGLAVFQYQFISINPSYWIITLTYLYENQNKLTYLFPDFTLSVWEPDRNIRLRLRNMPAEAGITLMSCQGAIFFYLNESIFLRHSPTLFFLLEISLR